MTETTSPIPPPSPTPAPPTRARWFRRHPKLALILFVLVVAVGFDLVVGALVIPGVVRCPHPVYHHGLLPNRTVTATWGEVKANVYPMITNSLGFRDRAERSVPLQSDRKRLLVIGDSFGEGIGVPYEQTFVGLIEDELGTRDEEVLNASVVSYSPKLYHLKVKYLLEEVGLKFDRLLVCIDISDIVNELCYQSFEPVPFDPAAEFQHDLARFGRGHSYLWYWLSQRGKPEGDVDFGAGGLFPCLANTDQRMLADPDFSTATFAWTVDTNLYNKYGRQGLIVARRNLQKLVNLCKAAKIPVTIAVYPWPQQIVSKDLDSVQVRTWRAFAKANGIGFIDLFPKFIDGTPYEEVEKKFFLVGDVHWNAAGHRVVADAVLAGLK